VRSLNKTFLLGIGEAKCGTTWLHEYCKKAPNYVSPNVKEWNIWTEYFSYGKAATSYNDETKKIRHSMLNTPEFYEEYFTKILSDPKHTITSDISPSYSCLSTQNHQHLKQRLDRYFNLKVVYLFRDPVLTAWSAYKHDIRTKKGNYFAEPDIKEFVQGYDNQLFMSCNYVNVIRQIKSVYKEQLLVMPYERLFAPNSNNGLIELSNFLGIEPMKEEKNIMHNVGQPGDLPDWAKREAWNLLMKDPKVAGSYSLIRRDYPDVYEQWMKGIVKKL